MSKHTPGPWKTFASGNGVWKGAVLAQDRTPVATVSACAARQRERSQRANLNLIAAAPDLLEALKALVLDVTDPKDGAPPYRAPRQVHIDNARAAIAKAEK